MGGKGRRGDKKNLISSIVLEPDDLEAHVRKLEAKYSWRRNSRAAARSYLTEDAEILLVGSASFRACCARPSISCAPRA